MLFLSPLSVLLLGPWESCCLGFQKLSCVQNDVKKLHDFFFIFFFWKPLCWVSLNYLEFPISCCSPCLEEFHSKEKFCSVSLCVRSAGSFTPLFPQGVAIKNRIVKFVCLMFQDGEQKLSISQSAFTLMYTMAFFLSLEGIWTPFQNKNSTMEVCGLFRQQKQPTSLKKLRLSGFFILWSTNWMH